jgi:hypothetical protein
MLSKLASGMPLNQPFISPQKYFSLTPPLCLIVFQVTAFQELRGLAMKNLD